MSQQGLRQASFRAIHGETGGSLNEDMLKAFAAEATIPAGATFNEAFMLWLQERLSSSDNSLPGLMQAFAEANGAHNWAGLGSVSAIATTPAVDSFSFNFDGTANTSRALTLSGVAGDLFVICTEVLHSARSPVLASGYTPLFSGIVLNGPYEVLWQYMKLTGAVENPAFEITGSISGRWGVSGVKITGAGASPIDASNRTVGTVSNNDPVCPAVTTKALNRLVLRWFAASTQIASDDANYPANTTGLFARTVGTAVGQCGGLAWHNQETAGDTGAAEFTDAMATNSAVKINATIAIRA